MLAFVVTETVLPPPFDRFVLVPPDVAIWGTGVALWLLASACVLAPKPRVASDVAGRAFTSSGSSLPPGKTKASGTNFIRE